MASIPQIQPRRQLAQWRIALGENARPAIFVALTLVGIVAGLLLEHNHASPALILAVHAATFFFGGYDAVRAIIEALKERTIEVDLLMVLAASGAAYLGEWTEGAILLFLFSLSNVLQDYAMNRTRNAISSLMELRPDAVMVRRDERMLELPLEQVQVGDIVALRPGDRVALDGEILRGSGNFDESSLTGESLPVHKDIGAPVFAGTLNQNGSLDMRVGKPAAESTLARIIDMVGEAQERKAGTQGFLDRAEQYYAVGVLLAVGLFIALVPWIFGIPFADNFYRAMVLLTVASPCALVISVPASLLSAIAAAARRGVLFKGGGALEQLNGIETIAFDKTGTLTLGKPEVMDVLPEAGVSTEELLAVVARAEQPSEHPIASAILSYTQAQGIAPQDPEYFHAITGMGIRAVCGGETTLVGSARLMQEEGLEVPAAMQARADELAEAGRGTTLLVNRGGRWLGIVTVADRVRPEAARWLAGLRKSGVKRIVMLTGDNERVANALGRQLGIDEVHAGLLPEDKLRRVEKLRERHGSVAMVGDGVNDAPALAAATVGIAMGGAGTDAALESADVVLMSDDLGALGAAVRLSKQAMRIVWQNIAFALAVAVTLVILTVTIGIPLPVGVIGHEGSTIIVVLNGLRLLAFRD